MIEIKEDNQKLLESIDFFIQAFENGYLEEEDKKEIEKDIRKIRNDLNNLKTNVKNIAIIRKR